MEDFNAGSNAGVRDKTRDVLGIFFKWRVCEKDPSKVMKQLITWWLRGGQRTSRVGGQAGFQAPSRGQRDRCGRGKHSWMELLGRTFIF